LNLPTEGCGTLTDPLTYGTMTSRPTSAPRIRRPRGGTYGAVRIVYVEGRGYYVEPTDPTALPPGQRTLGLCRRWADALTFVQSGAAERTLVARLAGQEAA
jgi:hypothetical protein